MLFEWENRGPRALDFEKNGAHLNFEVNFWPFFKTKNRENAENKILKKYSKIFIKNYEFFCGGSETNYLEKSKYSKNFFSKIFFFLKFFSIIWIFPNN